MIERPRSAPIHHQQDFEGVGVGDPVAMKTVIKIGAHVDRIEHHHNSSSVDVVETHSVPTTPTPIDNYNHILQQQLGKQQRALGPVERKQHQEQCRARAVYQEGWLLVEKNLRVTNYCNISMKRSASSYTNSTPI